MPLTLALSLVVLLAGGACSSDDTSSDEETDQATETTEDESDEVALADWQDAVNEACAEIDERTGSLPEAEDESELAEILEEGLAAVDDFLSKVAAAGTPDELADEAVQQGEALEEGTQTPDVGELPPEIQEALAEALTTCVFDG